jgi:hypothetical protein
VAVGCEASWYYFLSGTLHLWGRRRVSLEVDHDGAGGFKLIFDCDGRIGGFR